MTDNVCKNCRIDELKDAVCYPPFGETFCHAPINGIWFWPTTTACSEKLAEMHLVDANHTAAMQEIVLEAHAECSAITTEVCSG